MTFTKDQMRAVAEKLGYEVKVFPGSDLVPFVLNQDKQYVAFNPSINGSTDQQAFALQCIVAADKIRHLRHNREHLSKDLLTASIAALLAEGEGV